MKKLKKILKTIVYFMVGAPVLGVMYLCDWCKEIIRKIKNRLPFRIEKI